MNPALVTTRSYESTRDVLTSIQNKAGETTRSTYIYSVVNGGVNSIGQRKGVRTNFNLGGAHTANPGDTSWSYDNLGQLTSANHGSNDSIDRAYQYDAIGNRTFAEKGAPQIPTTPGLNTTGYTANALNQYNAITAYNTSGVAGTPISPVFDADGNMEQGPLPVSPGTNCTLVWDAENRLIEVKSASNVTLVKYAYDALSRRISRNVSASPNSYTLYLYDGWNCIAEWNANSQSATLTTTRTWGLDLSTTPQGAGGVGGLLSEKQGNNTFYPTYDGNGNISEYLAADGSTAAHYEYDPFGNIVKESYASAYDTSSFSYKFSTKPLDQATGLYYYGYRYYDPQTGRWPSRDPIGEEGGVNLYGFVGNSCLNESDFLGLCEKGKIKDVKVTVQVQTGGANTFSGGNSNEKFKKLVTDGNTAGATEELRRWSEGLARGISQVSQAFGMGNYIRELQGGLVMTDAKVSASAKCCLCKDNRLQWSNVEGEGNWDGGSGSSLLSESSRKTFVDGMYEAALEAAQDIVGECQ